MLSELYRQVEAGMVSLDDTTTVSSQDAYYDSVAGDVNVSPGATVTLRQAARLRKKSRERSVETTPKLAKVTP